MPVGNALTRMLAAVFAAAMTALFAAAPVTAAEKTFGAWLATCKNDDACAAITTIASPKGTAADYVLHLDRRTPAAALTIAISMSRNLMDRDRPIALRIDDASPLTLRPTAGYAPFGAVNDFYVTDKSRLKTLLATMLAGSELRLSYIDVAGAPHDVDFSLSGLTAALLWIDERQDRVGKPRGLAAPDHLDPAPHVAATEVTAAGGLPPQVLERHLTRSDCEDPTAGTMAVSESIVAPLSKTAILYAIPCTTHAYNVTYRLYVVESGEIGGTETLYFADYSDDHGWTGTDLLFNVSFDATTGRLSSFYKGRGLADCGSAGVWRWKDYAFAMEEFRAWSRCDGTHPPDTWPLVFKAAD